jgi:hypothetical protein
MPILLNLNEMRSALFIVATTPSKILSRNEQPLEHRNDTGTNVKTEPSRFNQQKSDRQ